MFMAAKQYCRHVFGVSCAARWKAGKDLSMPYSLPIIINGNRRIEYEYPPIQLAKTIEISLFH
jgi:hypothetical protein